MAVAAPATPRMTVREFLEWQGGEPDVRYELYRGVPVAMAPTRLGHQALIMSLGRQIGDALDARPGCSVLGEAAIAPWGEESDRLYIADLAVTCTPLEATGSVVPDPILIVEVLSPSTEDHDRKVKALDYRRIPSVREILLIDPRRIYCEIQRRSDAGWLLEIAHRPEDDLVLESIGLRLPLATVYEKVPLPEDEATPETGADVADGVDAG